MAHILGSHIEQTVECSEPTLYKGQIHFEAGTYP